MLQVHGQTNVITTDSLRFTCMAVSTERSDAVGCTKSAIQLIFVEYSIQIFDFHNYEFERKLGKFFVQPTASLRSVLPSAEVNPREAVLNAWVCSHYSAFLNLYNALEREMWHQNGLKTPKGPFLSLKSTQKVH